MLKRLAATLASLLGLAPATGSPGKSPEEPPTIELRAKALAMPPSDIGLSRGTYSRTVWAVLMDVGLEGGSAYTLMVLGDGTTSLYFSTGGGIIGAGTHKNVQAVSSSYLDTAGQFVSGVASKASANLPTAGRVKFYIRTFDGTYTYEASEDDLGNERDRFSPLFHKAHEVITQVRLQQEQSQ